jgi:hypothetical protein
MANSLSGESLLSSEPFIIPQALHPLHPSSIFDVEGLVVVITGGGTGKWFGSSTNYADVSIPGDFIGIGLMMAKALENNGAIVYIVGRRLDVLEKATREHNVRQPFTFLLSAI